MAVNVPLYAVSSTVAVCPLVGMYDPELGQLMEGGVVSEFTTKNEHELRLPSATVALHVTLNAPSVVNV